MKLQNSINNLNPNVLPSGSYTVTANDFIIVANTVSSSPTITLPSAPKTGQSYKIIDGSGNASINPIYFNSGSKTINGGVGFPTVSSVNVGSGATGVAITPNGQYAYVTNFGPDGAGTTVSVISGASTTPVISSNISVGSSPDGIAITPDGKSVYITNATAGSNITIIPNASTGGGTPFNISVDGNEPFGTAITPNGNFSYVTNGISNSVSIISSASNSPFVMFSALPVGNSPHGICITPDGKYAYVANSNNTVSIIANVSSNPFVYKTLSIPGCYNIATTPSGNLIYVAGGAGFSFVSIINNNVTSINNNYGELYFTYTGTEWLATGNGYL